MKNEGTFRSAGEICPQEMVRRFWLAVTAGVYGGHGETYLDAGGLDADEFTLPAETQFTAEIIDP